MTMIELANFTGVFVFAATGALAASRRQLDMMGFIFLANVTGLGGGTLRDLVLGDSPVFWVKEPSYLLASTLAAVLVYFTAHLVESRYRALLWLDAIGMAAYTVMGAAKGLALGFGPAVAIVTGIFTATLGGILRDMVAGEPSVLMRREIYVTASLAGAWPLCGAGAFRRGPAACRHSRRHDRLCGARRGARLRLDAAGL